MLYGVSGIMLAATGQLDHGSDLGCATLDTGADNVRRFAHGAHLFSGGDRRTARFRILDGAVCHYIVWPDGHHEVLEFLYPGDVVGLGSLAEHVSTAQAMVDTRAVALTDAEFNTLLAKDAALATRASAAADREFAYVRRRALGNGTRSPKQRIAAYLLAASSQACRLGEQLHVGIATHERVALANLLEIPVAAVESALEALAHDGAIRIAPDGVIITDMRQLEVLTGSA